MNIKENGRMGREAGSGDKYIKRDIYTKGGGIMIKSKGLER